MTPKDEISPDDIHKYLKQWRSDEQWTDFNLAWDLGYTDYAAWLIWSAGAIGSDQCYDWAKPYELAIEELMKTYDKSKQLELDRNDLLQGVRVYVRENDNETAFITREDCMSDKDMESMGFKFDHQY